MSEWISEIIAFSLIGLIIFITSCFLAGGNKKTLAKRLIKVLLIVIFTVPVLALLWALLPVLFG